MGLWRTAPVWLWGSGVLQGGPGGRGWGCRSAVGCQGGGLDSGVGEGEGVGAGGRESEGGQGGLEEECGSHHVAAEREHCHDCEHEAGAEGGQGKGS